MRAATTRASRRCASARTPHPPPPPASSAARRSSLSLSTAARSVGFAPPIYTIRYTHRQQTRDSRDADARSPRPVSALAFPPNRPRTKGQGLEPSIEPVSTRPRAGAAGGRLDGVDAIRRPARAGRAAGGPNGGPEGAGRPSAPPDSSTLHTGLITRVLDSRCWRYCGRAGRTCRSGPSPGRSRRRWARRPPRA